MKFEVTAKPVFHFTPTEQQIACLISLARLYYDGRCKAAAQQGGFIYGWRNAIVEFKMPEVSASWHDLDTTMKIIEMVNYMPDPRHRECLKEFGRAINGAMNAIPGAVEQWKIVIDTL